MLSDQYNDLLKTAYDDYVDFVSFHYHTGRQDTEFWRDYQKPDSITPTNARRMEKWKHAFPTREDFPGMVTLHTVLTTGLVIWMPMLSALDYLNREHARRQIALSDNRDQCRSNVTSYLEARNHIWQRGVSQEDAIAYLREGR